MARQSLPLPIAMVLLFLLVPVVLLSFSSVAAGAVVVEANHNDIVAAEPETELEFEFEPRDARWEKRIAAHRRFLTREGRESLRHDHNHNHENRNRNRELAAFVVSEEGLRDELEDSNDNDNEDGLGRDRDRDRDLHRALAPRSSAPVLNVIVCLLQWKNHPDRHLALTRDTIERMFNGIGIGDEQGSDSDVDGDIDGNSTSDGDIDGDIDGDGDSTSDNGNRDADLYPGGTIKDYFSTISYGAFEVNFSVTDWTMADEYTEQDFTADGSRGRTQDLQRAFVPALQALDDALFRFRDYDGDYDRTLDLVVFLHSGYDGSEGGVDCETGKTADERVASHARVGADASDWMSRGGYQLGAYVVAPAFRGTCDLEIGRIGTIVHEMIHPFGLPDLYDGQFGNYGTGNLGGIDRFGVMANPSGNAGNGDDEKLAWPGHPSAWTRKELGWITPVEIVEDGLYTLRNIEEHPELFVLRTGFANDKEYLLIENRQAIPGDFDEKFFDPGGILVYHIDENIWDDNDNNDGSLGVNEPRGGPFQPGWPENGNHYPVALLQADGLYELEQGINGGDVGDIWNLPSQVLGPGNANGNGNDSTNVYPNTDSYAFGTVKSTGIYLFAFQFETEGSTTMTFRVCGLSDGATCDSDILDVDADTDADADPDADTETPTLEPTKEPTNEPTAEESTTPTNEPTTTTPTTTSEPNSREPTTQAPTSAPTSIERLENGRCEVAADAVRASARPGAIAVSNITNSGTNSSSSATTGKTCYSRGKGNGNDKGNGNESTGDDKGMDREGVWYTIEAGSVPAGETIRADTCFPETNAFGGNNNNTTSIHISVLKGESCATLGCVVDVDEINCLNGEQGRVVYWTAEANEDYFLFVQSLVEVHNNSNTNTNGITSSIDVDALGSTPASDGIVRLEIESFAPVGNDDCDTALVVSIAPLDVSASASIVYSGFTTEGARPESRSNLTTTTCGVESAGVWFRVNGTGSNLRATTCLPGTDAPTQIHVFSGSCGSLSCISVEAGNSAVCSGSGSDDSDIAPNSATVNWETEDGVEYFILVGSRNGSFGSFELSVSEITPVTNDHCPDALEFDLSGTRVQSITQGSTEYGSNDFPYGEYCGLPLDTAGVWYTIEGTGEGLLVSTCGKSNYDSAISIFTGSDCDALKCLTGVSSLGSGSNCNANDGATVSWKSEPNEMYYVYVHGAASVSSGNSYGIFGILAQQFFATEYNGFCNAALSVTEPGVTIKVNANATNANLNVNANVNATNATVFGETIVPFQPSKVCVADTSTTHRGFWYTYEGTGFPFLMSGCPVGRHEYDVSISVFSGDSCGELSCESGITFTQEFCAGTTDEPGVNMNSTRHRKLEDRLYHSVESEVGVVYRLFVHWETSNTSNPSSIDAVDVVDFEISFFPQVQPASPSADTSKTAVPTASPDADTSKTAPPIDETLKEGRGVEKNVLLMAIFIPFLVLLLICLICSIPLYLGWRKKTDSDRGNDGDVDGEDDGDVVEDLRNRIVSLDMGDMEESPFSDERSTGNVSKKSGNTKLSKSQWQTL